ncbi:transmembrane protein 106B [Elysia marginata]|uniref:Transmembrane protein 106B n=1 Tax=Elysia marginata TaxID=1093978 RepID=A0AAV4HK17_9GAST|nr:transmembrane protein 106B [Elysia marginata]
MASVQYDEDCECDNDASERSLIVASSNHRVGSRPNQPSYSSLSQHSHSNGGYSSQAPGSPPTGGTATTGNIPVNGGYEELFKDSVPCPSCRGLGRVPKELENQLVALIPMKDGRLKPRRTILYVAIAVGLCILTAGLLIFFLMPRDITISSNRPFLQPKHIDINVTAKFANFTVINRYNVSNNNFYSVKISGVAMKSLYGNAVIAQSSAYKQHPLEISARSEDELLVPMDFILSGEHGSLVSHCMSNWSWIHNLPILFEVTANYTYMGHSEQATLTTFQTVSCHPQPKPASSTAKSLTAGSSNRETSGSATRRFSSRARRDIREVIHLLKSPR